MVKEFTIGSDQGLLLIVIEVKWFMFDLQHFYYSFTILFIGCQRDQNYVGISISDSPINNYKMSTPPVHKLK